MRILLIIGCKRFSISRRLNAGFVEKLINLPEVTELITYDFKTLISLQNDLKKKLLDIYNEIKPDIVLCYAKAHSPVILPFLEKIDCPKVCIEVDYYKSPKSKEGIYKRGRFDLVIQRGSFVLSDDTIPSVWLPFSADDKIFYPLSSISQQENFVGFSGSLTKIYSQRRSAVLKLTQANLLRECKCCYSDELYSSFLRRMKICLTSSEINSPHGKVFEIMASGSVVLTPPFYGEDVLFGPNCFIHYEKDCSNIVNRAKVYLKRRKKYNIVRNNSYEIFKQKHTDDIRLRELFMHLDNVINNKPVCKPWGI